MYRTVEQVRVSILYPDHNQSCIKTVSRGYKEHIMVHTTLSDIVRFSFSAPSQNSGKRLLAGVFVIKGIWGLMLGEIF
jgi:hypothetical protein